MRYRKDIDGLRAIAVLVVIFCHLGIYSFKGGFLGVDIFFVISGFLITYNITQKLSEGRFSFKSFYLNRIKRIAPVLIVILILLTIFNLFVLLPDPLRNYLEFLPYASLGLGNYAAANLGHGYFDAVSERYQLLHTWSLGVEEQFYLLVPVLFFLIWKIKQPKYRNILITCIYLFSICLSIYFVEFTDQTKSNYYLLHTRFFEIFTGSMLAIFYNQVPLLKSKNGVGGLYLASFFLLFFFSYFFDGSSPWPGTNALLVSLITIVIIYLGKEGNSPTLFKQILEHGTMRFIGKISYSLYLWHWIIIATLVELGYEVSEFTLLGKLLLLSVVMIPISYLSWKYVENTFRYNVTYKFRYAFMLWVVLPVLCTVGLFKYQKLAPEKFYAKAEIDNTGYSYSSNITPHLKVNENPLTKEIQKKYGSMEYFIGDYLNRKKTKEITTKEAEVLILANSHFHAFKHFVDKQLKEKKLVGHVLHERTATVYRHKNAKQRYVELLKGKKYVVIWVKLDNINFAGTKTKWERWIIDEALKQGVQPIFYVPGLELSSDNEARKNIYGNILFGKTAQEKENQDKLFGNIPALQYAHTLFDDYKDKIRWVDFKPLMCADDTCQLWSNDIFALFDKHHITRQVGYELGEDYQLRYENIFDKSWKQTPILFNKPIAVENDLQESEDEIHYKNDGYTIRIDLLDKTYSIIKDYKESDKESMFFFHVFPEELDVLPENRKKHKFANLDIKGGKQISFTKKDTFFFGKNNLPDYKIKSIHLGHFKPKGDKFFEKTFHIPRP
ncbi:acyltransferase family protein [Maribacter chungangensis]|uniref:Acyltransferase family protein n=1 Tax=Maribacter chungangensis TaxID=1069117 RepID=A0ABW3AZ91_9FLAO